MLRRSRERGRGLLASVHDLEQGLTADQAREILTGAASTLLDAALAQAGTDRDSPN